MLKRLALSLLAIWVAACSDPTTTEVPRQDTVQVGSTTSAPPPEAPPSARLPDGVRPLRYQLDLNVDPRQARFGGRVEIDVELAGITQRLWLHGNDLDVTVAEASLSDGSRVSLSYEQLADRGVAMLSFPQALPGGKATLHFEYTAPFNTSLEGLYKVTQGEHDYAFTQFQATSARLAFPSFDEPAFKVPFDIRMTVPAGFTAITNTPEQGRRELDDSTEVTFVTTRPLPTYLVAFAVGEFDVVSGPDIPPTGKRKNPVALRGITTRGRGPEIEFALRNTADIVLEMEDYFDTPYPYRKLDLIAVPDFGAGAMENAGAITYREQLILLDENSPVGRQRAFFRVHAHELAHQWFGNLVTPLWWDDIWLNESFATWNAAIILDRLYPQENFREELQNAAAYVMKQDALASARQIREPIERHEDIGSAFNGITYQKGGGVLSMFETFMGREAFRDGVRSYMKTHAWGNTTAGDFIEAIATANPQLDSNDLQEAFRSYIGQPGLPVLTTKLQCGASVANLIIEQQRYLPAGSEGSKAGQWVVPACMTLGDRVPQCFLVKETSQSIPLGPEDCPDFVMPNTGGNGYYRWSLPTVQWHSLLKQFPNMSIGEQISFASNLSAALHAGEIELDDYLDTVPTIAASQSFRVALIPRGDLYLLHDYVASEAERPVLRTLIAQAYRPSLDRLNAKDQLSNDETSYRKLMMSTLALGARDPEMLEFLTQQGSAFTGYGVDEALHPELIDPNLRSISLLVASRELGKPFADLLWRHFLNSPNATLREEMLRALAYSLVPEVQAVMRERILSPELRDNEIFNIYGGQMSTDTARLDLWEWTRNNMDAVLERMPRWRKGQLPRYLQGFCSRESATAIKNVFEPIIEELESGPRYLANTLESTRLCAAFVDLYRTAG